MHSDFQMKKQSTELESLTKYVISEGRKYNLATPQYIKVYAELKKKSIQLQKQIIRKTHK